MNYSYSLYISRFTLLNSLLYLQSKYNFKYRVIKIKRQQFYIAAI